MVLPEDLGNKAVFRALVMHADDQKLEPGLFGSGGIVEHLGDVFDFLFCESEADHFGAEPSCPLLRSNSTSAFHKS